MGAKLTDEQLAEIQRNRPGVRASATALACVPPWPAKASSYPLPKKPCSTRWIARG